MGARSPLFRSGLLLLLVVAAVYGTSPVVTNGDSYLSYPTAVSLVHERNLNLDEFAFPSVQDHYGTVHIAGHSYDSYPWAVSLFFLPAVIGLDALHAAGLAPSAADLVRRDQMGLVQMWTASLVTAVAALLVFLIAYARSTGDERRRRCLAFGVALVFALGTAAWSTASRAMWQHGPSMLALAAVVLLAIRVERGDASTRDAFVLGAALAAAAAFRPTNVVVAALILTWVLRCRRRLVLGLVAGGAVVAVIWLTLNLLGSGQLISDYNSPGRRLVMHRDFLNAVAANLVSTGRGLVVFSPVVALAVAGLVVRRRRGELTMLDVVFAVAVVLQLLVVSASREAWWAGHAFGPRFMSDVLPLLAYLAMPAVDRLTGWSAAARAVVATAVVWSVFVNASGAYLHAAHCWNTVPVDVDVHPNRVWSLHQPQVLEGWRKFATSPKGAITGECPAPGRSAAGAVAPHG